MQKRFVLNKVDSNKIIGITGGTCSGKTTITQNIIKKLNREEVSYFSLDNYYKDQSHIPLEKRNLINYDRPYVIGFDLFINHLERIKNNKYFYVPIYDFKTHTRKGNKKIMPSKITIIEGILLFNEQKVRKYFDLKIFLDVEDDIRLIRRIKRDIEERDRSIWDVLNQYLSTVRDMHTKYVLPQKQYADLIINNNTSGIDSIMKLIKKIT